MGDSVTPSVSKNSLMLSCKLNVRNTHMKSKVSDCIVYKTSSHEMGLKLHSPVGNIKEKIF